MTDQQSNSSNPYEGQGREPAPYAMSGGTEAFGAHSQGQGQAQSQAQPKAQQDDTMAFGTQPQPQVHQGDTVAFGAHAQQTQGAYQQPQAQQGNASGFGARQGQTAQAAPMHAATAASSHAAASAPFSPGTSAPSAHKKGGTGKTFLAGFVGAALACVIALGGFAVYQSASGGSSSSSSSGTTLGATTSTTVDASDEDTTLAQAVAEKALPSVAAIDVYSASQSSGYYGYGYGSSSGSSDTLTQSSLGSGVVLSEDGYILTNYHVIEGSDALKVTVDGNEYDAEVVGTDSSSDLAVVKATDASGLTAIELGDSDSLSVGEWVMSIGSPFGLEQSVATGIVSATSRSQIMQDSSTDIYGQSSGTGTTMLYANLIQTDAAINPGNSGGALVDSDGKLIGINTLITSYSGNYSGVGFAIPVNYAVNIAQQIIDGKTPTHAQLGVSLATIDSSTAQRYGLSVSQGAYISSVSSGTGAEEAGLQRGDIVTKFEGQDVTSASDLMLDIRSKNAGDTVTLEINRDGQTMEVQVTLGDDSSTQEAQSQQQSYSSVLGGLLGGSSSGD